ncbi:hypothetical protein [Bauldia litoralis]|uniref:Uncharacterized protein n=1 Tax=Bauldia litoralis TaxID=665467 RepID=A0A1G6EHS7_9HYPH|nr:hypothetical protein [Bauldia litoralis]SDB56971.1 hypothetical protein SAMN02982931_04543 [Bauldia litoralis]
MSSTPAPAFVVTDVELDGPSPLRNSMLSFASVAIDGRGAVLDEFEAVLAPRADRAPDDGTSAWWATQPDAWAEATRAPQPAETVMPRYADWLETLPSPRLFAARPLILDGPWIDHYLDTYVGCRVISLPRAKRVLFAGAGLDISSFAAALAGLDHVTDLGKRLSDDWLGHVPHTHRAIDDARGYANVLARLLAMAATRTTEGALT